MERETDIFGGVTPFEEEQKKEVVDVPVYEQQVVEQPVAPVPEEPVAPVTVEPSYGPVPTEEPVAPVPTEEAYGQVQEEEFNGIAQPIVEDIKEEVSNSNLNPIEQKQDENAGLKFLLILGLIFAITIILLPYFL